MPSTKRVQEYALPDENEQVVKVLEVLEDTFNVESTSGEKFQVSVHEAHKNVSSDTYLIVKPIAKGKKAKAEIVHVLDEAHVHYISEHSLWPKEFEAALGQKRLKGSNEDDEESLGSNEEEEEEESDAEEEHTSDSEEGEASDSESDGEEGKQVTLRQSESEDDIDPNATPITIIDSSDEEEAAEAEEEGGTFEEEDEEGVLEEEDEEE